MNDQDELRERQRAQIERQVVEAPEERRDYWQRMQERLEEQERVERERAEVKRQ